ncbi:hypothetical protein E3N88_31038 [Mikania micrantha]|uniref:Pentatricopeptide repeat-containing protein n=1 Tax=Mikania micrantha TaxID=192012 RepID=A0A5N6MR94_9ASTR|nr:hypothetical protein E3N88_31038 [Mikania micrantha]
MVVKSRYFSWVFSLHQGGLISKLASVLQSCSNPNPGLQVVQQGQQLHAQILVNGINHVGVLGSRLLGMYILCGKFIDAKSMFHKLDLLYASPWNWMIRGFTMMGCFDSAILMMGFETDVYVGSLLIKAYVENDCIDDALHMFDKLPQRDDVLWNVILNGSLKHGDSKHVLLLFNQMRSSKTRPGSVTYACVLSACASDANIKLSTQIHGLLIKCGQVADLQVLNTLIAVYAKCQLLFDARELFNSIQEAGSVTWNVLISGHVQNGIMNEALYLLREMIYIGTKPDPITLASFLPSLSESASINQGKEIHCYILRQHVHFDVFLKNALIDIVIRTAMIYGYVLNGMNFDALKIFRCMLKKQMRPNAVTLSSSLPACAGLAALKLGKELHGQIFKKGLEGRCHVGISVMDMYAKCGRLDLAHQVFVRMSEKDSLSWNSMITSFCHNSQPEKAIDLFHEMGSKGAKYYSVSMSAALSACANVALIGYGKAIHRFMTKGALKTDVYAESALIDMYAKCGNLESAITVFNIMQEKNEVSWNSIISAYGSHGHLQECLSLFHEMKEHEFQPDHVTFLAIISPCDHTGLIDDGHYYFKSITNDYGITPQMEHYACMIDLFGRAGRVKEAYEIIKSMPFDHDAGVWGAMLGASRVQGNVELAEIALGHLFDMDPTNSGYYVLLSNVQTDAGKWNFKFLQSCSNPNPGLQVVQQSQQLHAQILVNVINHVGVLGSRLLGMYTLCGKFIDAKMADLQVLNTLIAVYAKCQWLFDARKLFNSIQEANSVTWNVLIGGHVQNGLMNEALDAITLASFFPSLSESASINQGKEIHCYILRQHVHFDVFLKNALIGLYFKCREVEMAHNVFTCNTHIDIVIRTAMIYGYVLNGMTFDALKIFRCMLKKQMRPNVVTLSSSLPACAGLAALKLGKELHGQIFKKGLEGRCHVETSVMDMYAKCGRFDLAHQVFVRMSEKDFVSWNSMITSFFHNSQPEKAIDLFHEMGSKGAKYDSVTISAALSACANVALFVYGKAIHGFMTRGALKTDVYAERALYAKCGNLESTITVFNIMQEKNEVSWNNIISAYGNHGHHQECLSLFHRMKEHGFQPDHVIFLAIISACDHTSLIDDGHYYFKSMTNDYGITPQMEHYACMIDMFGRAGRVNEAYEIIKSMPFDPDASVWGALLMLENGPSNVPKEYFLIAEEIFQNSIVVKRRYFNKANNFMLKYLSMELTMWVYWVHDYLECTYFVENSSMPKYVHHTIQMMGFETDVYVGSLLIKAYVENDCIDDALHMFDKLPQRDDVLWNVILNGSLKHGDSKHVLLLFNQMRNSKTRPGSVTYACVLSACACDANIKLSTQIHGLLIKCGQVADLQVLNTLIAVYAKCQLLFDAWELFNSIKEAGSVTWNVLISGHVQNGIMNEALDLLREMIYIGTKPDPITLASFLPSLSESASINQGKEIHCYILRQHVHFHVFLNNALIDMYFKCREVQMAHNVFTCNTDIDIVICTAMISSYVLNGMNFDALKIFRCTLKKQMRPNDVTLSSSLPACAGLAALKLGKELHGQIFKKGLEGSVMWGRQSWICMQHVEDLILHTNQPEKAIDLFHVMGSKGAKYDSVGDLRMCMSACASDANIKLGTQIHGLLIKCGQVADLQVHNTQIAECQWLYAKCQWLFDARELFNSVQEAGSVTWNVLISGHVQNGLRNEALDLHREMIYIGTKPDAITLASFLPSLSESASINQGKEIHCYILRQHVHFDVFLKNALIDM